MLLLDGEGGRGGSKEGEANGARIEIPSRIVGRVEEGGRKKARD